VTAAEFHGRVEALVGATSTSGGLHARYEEVRYWASVYEGLYRVSLRDACRFARDGRGGAALHYQCDALNARRLADLLCRSQAALKEIIRGGVER